MGLNGTQHFMRAAGIDPENPIGSLLEKAGLNADEVMTTFKAVPEIIKGIADRQMRVELALSVILENQTRIESKLDALMPPVAGVYPVGEDVTATLDAFHRRGLGLVPEKSLLGFGENTTEGETGTDILETQTRAV